MIVKAAIKFLLTYSDAQLITTVRGLVEGITNNANFPSPTPKLDLVTTALDAFVVAVADAANGGKELTAMKDAKRRELVSVVRQLASYVTIAADGDLTKLLSAAFPIQKPTRSKIGMLPAPEVPRLKLGPKSGQMDASTIPMVGGYVYNWRAALASAPTVYVKTAQTTGARYLFEELTPGEAYIVDVSVVGSAGMSDWSGSAELMVV
jgi:hypothetical protein